MCYGRLRMDVLELCRYYASWLGNPLMERLKHEIYELLEEAISWWGESGYPRRIDVGGGCLLRR